jgi:hypothetical protein
MCLWIKSDQDLNERDLNKWFGNRKKFAYVYKILIKAKNEDFYRSARFNSFIWDFSKQKVFEVRRDPKPTKSELNRERINFGLHVYTSFEEVKYWDYYKPDSAIVKFRVNKEDIVAIQNSSLVLKRYHYKEAVCKKLEFVKVLKNKE